MQECAIAVECMRGLYPQVSSLRDATPEVLEKSPMPRLVMRRARHIVSENLRVELFVNAAAKGNLERMGELFNESHRSMQHDYEITCDEVDFLVDAAVGIPGCFGARMTGGGFGGCTVNLVEPGSVHRFSECDRHTLCRTLPEFSRRSYADDVPAEGACEVETDDLADRCA